MMMRDGNLKKSKLSWSKMLVKNLFRGKVDEFQADDMFLKERASKSNHWRRHIDLDCAQVTELNNYRIFVATWNVAGKSPPSHLSLEDWLHTSPSADIYVLGFQEVVPLNAGNVLGAENNGPAKKWLKLTRKTLNNLPDTNDGYHTAFPASDPSVESDFDFEGSTMQKESSFSHCDSFQSLRRSIRMDNNMIIPQPRHDRHSSVCDRVILGHRLSDYDSDFKWCSSDDENANLELLNTSNYTPVDYSGSLSMDERNRGQSRYCLVASKQMVGIFLTIWIKSDLRDNVHNIKASCVGRGLMGYLGNKGSISISMTLHQTSFCFICSHLTSGQKEGDELRRNSDVMEIIRKTRFSRVCDRRDVNSPQTILDHDQIIWLGDLNYRIALSYHHVKSLVEMQNWKTLLQYDQLRMEQKRGRVFQGWNEGKIYFPPTYKYCNNSDRYAGDDRQRKEKCRTPAWCDRILWYGRGLHQLSYIRGESRFSDHRPVCSTFLAEVESTYSHIRKNTSHYSSKIEAEELLPFSHTCTDMENSLSFE